MKFPRPYVAAALVGMTLAFAPPVVARWLTTPVLSYVAAIC